MRAVGTVRTSALDSWVPHLERMPLDPDRYPGAPTRLRALYAPRPQLLGQALLRRIPLHHLYRPGFGSL